MPHVFLEIDRVATGTWRICDGGLPRSDPRRIVGVIELDAGAFDVVALRPAPSPCGRYAEWSLALQSLRRTLDGETTEAQSPG